MLGLRAVFNMLVRNVRPTGPMCFRCLVFSLSGPCKLLFLLYCFLDLSCGECNGISLYLMDLFVLCVACLTVFVICLVKQFAIRLVVVAILLLNIMEVFSVGGGAVLDRPCMAF